MNKLIPCLFGLFLLLFFSIRIDPTVKKTAEEPNTGSEKLVVITQAGDAHFLETCLPALQTWAAGEGIELIALDVAAGIPEEITATPAIVFQNDRDRAVYAGRYAELSTVKNFVRTQRLRTQPDALLCAEDVLQWQDGRGRLNAPLKITPLVMESRNQAVPADFSEKAKAAFDRGMESFVRQPEACLRRADRAYYCDVHPYLSASGELFLSLELYSMFNCIRPVFTTDQAPISGGFENYEQLFEQAAALLRSEIMISNRESEIGDAWSPLSASIAVVTWDALGLALPPRPVTAAFSEIEFALPAVWTTSGASLPGVPPLFFSFLAPLDRYAGEVPDLTGRLELNDDGGLRAGRFTADLRSLTMGMQELDDKVKRKYIYTKRFPEADFVFELETSAPLRSGVTNRVPVAGTFRFMKKEIPLRVQAELTPYLDDNASPQLLVHVPFELNITDDFGVDGPDGPDPARKTMRFDLNFLMSPE